MALVAMTTSDTLDYVSDLDPCKVKTKQPIDPAQPEAGEKEVVTIESGATTFKLRPLDVFLMGYIYNSASVLRGVQGSAEVGVHTRMHQTNIDAVRFGLAGFTNFSDARGNAIAFKTVKAVVNGRTYDAVDDSIMNQLGIRLVGELAIEIKKISEVSAAEEKN